MPRANLKASEQTRLTINTTFEEVFSGPGVASLDVGGLAVEHLTIVDPLFQGYYESCSTPIQRHIVTNLGAGRQSGAVIQRARLGQRELVEFGSVVSDSDFLCQQQVVFEEAIILDGSKLGDQIVTRLEATKYTTTGTLTLGREKTPSHKAFTYDESNMLVRVRAERQGSTHQFDYRPVTGELGINTTIDFRLHDKPLSAVANELTTTFAGLVELFKPEAIAK